MKMVKHMALPFVTICALVSVTVMAYEANYAGNPVTVTNGWDSRQYIASAQGYSSDSELKVLLKGLGKGAYIRLHKTGGGSDHSVVIANADSSSVTVYEANYGWKCDVGMRTLT